jgi:hypothetical protein
MTTVSKSGAAAETGSAGQSALRVLELLERLGNGEELAQAALAMGLNQEAAHASFRTAADIVRQSIAAKRWPARGSLLNWNEMTVAEALEILSDHAAGQESEAKKGT